MSLGKDSIQKRVAKPAEAPAATKPATTAKKTTSTAKKAPVKTAVVTKIAPEVVEKVIGHEEGGKVEIVSVGSDMPYYLL